MQNEQTESGAQVPCISLLAASDALLSACEKHIEAAETGDAQDWIESAETLEEAMQTYRDARKANKDSTSP